MGADEIGFSRASNGSTFDNLDALQLIGARIASR